MIGMPVGFVLAAEAKELLRDLEVRCIAKSNGHPATGAEHAAFHLQCAPSIYRVLKISYFNRSISLSGRSYPNL